MMLKNISGKMKVTGLACVFLLVLLMIFFYSSWDKAEYTSDNKEEEPLMLWIASDLHFLSPELADGGALFTRMVESGDGKMVGQSEEIVNAFLETALEKKPDALILSGDLTFNGEQKSLEVLADKLDKLQKAGIPVLVIPGNHDIESPYAYRYVEEKAESTAPITEKDFKEICGSLGYDAAVSRDKDSFSYLYQLSKDLGILLLDANTVNAPGEISQGSLSWMEKQLQWAKEQGMKIISVSHQNLLPQNDLLSMGFVIYNNGQVFDLLEKYDVNAHFSGHSHIWHDKTINGLTDTAVGSLTVTPLGYAVAEINNEGEVSCHQERLNILQDESREFFDTLTERKVRASLSGLSLDEEVKEKMVNFAVAVNRDYFSGTLPDTELLKRMESWALWKENGRETFWYSYLDSILN